MNDQSRPEYAVSGTNTIYAGNFYIQRSFNVTLSRNQLTQLLVGSDGMGPVRPGAGQSADRCSALPF